MAASQSATAGRGSLSHVERTAEEPREETLHRVTISSIVSVNESIRQITLGIEDSRGIKFLPGQWLDVHIPSLPRPGGFTITSTPAEARRPSSAAPATPQDPRSSSSSSSSASSPSPFLELAIQRSSQNPPAAWLWRPPSEILGAQLAVRVGGSFVWPPPGVADVSTIKRVVFVTGGVGINPLISILSHLSDTDQLPPSVHFLYAFRDPRGSSSSSSSSSASALDPSKVLFLSRVRSIVNRHRPGQVSLGLFVTGPAAAAAAAAAPQGIEHHNVDYGEDSHGDAHPQQDSLPDATIHRRRLRPTDVLASLGPPQQRSGTVAYVCGPQTLTDAFVKVIQDAENMAAERVLCEKWW
ncbi:MAG: hypothetical protein M1837_002725 [Sclerophora amabilis]|nr:MAG: hypothetical protein M1837_002725 [Sclerophora amabilis]